MLQQAQRARRARHPPQHSARQRRAACRIGCIHRRAVVNQEIDAAHRSALRCGVQRPAAVPCSVRHISAACQQLGGAGGQRRCLGLSGGFG